MRNRTWIAVVAVMAVTIVGFQIRNASSQERRRATERRTATAERDGMDSNKVTYAVAMVHPLGDHKVKGKVTFTEKKTASKSSPSLPACNPASTASTFTNSAIARWPTANVRAATSIRRASRTPAPMTPSATSATSATSKPTATATPATSAPTR